MPRVIHGDSAEKLKTVANNSVDMLCTDHPYRYGFMGKKWDKKRDLTPVWKEVFRVMKPGAFGFIMNAPRSDCQLLLLTELASVGFNLEFTQITWAYASGFSKAKNMYKAIDEHFFTQWYNLKYEKEIENYQSKKKYLKKTVPTKKELEMELEEAKDIYDKFRKSKKPEWAMEVYGKKIVSRIYEHPGRQNRSYQISPEVFSGDRKNNQTDQITIDDPVSPEAIQHYGYFAGCQPKPSYEVITVVMKPIDEKSYIAQCLKDGKGTTNIDGCRIPYSELNEYINNTKKGYCGNGGTGVLGWNNGKQKSCKDSDKPPQTREEFLKSPEGIALKKKLVGGRLKQEKRWTYGDQKVDGFKPQEFDDVEINLKGRFPANLLVSDNILDQKENQTKDNFSRYFSLDAWWEQKIGKNISKLPKEQQKTFPFLIVPKASKSEKNKGLDQFPTKQIKGGGGTYNEEAAGKYGSLKAPTKNTHATVKPIPLMCFLIILGSRPGDIVLDPYAGSGPTLISCHRLHRDYIGVELEKESYEIMKARLKYEQKQKKLF